MPPIRYLLVAVLIATIGVGLYFGLRKPSGPDSNPPEAVPVPEVRFTDATESTRIHFRHFNGASGKKLLPETMGSGVAVLDFDRDGKPDLLFVNSRAWPGLVTPESARVALYRNMGDGTFEDVSEQAGLAVSLFGMGVAVGDFDNDGFPDVLITVIGGNLLFHNVAGPEGSRRFVDISREANVGAPAGWPELSTEQFYRSPEVMPFPSSATFLDFDGDGKLDLFVCSYLVWSPAADLSVNAQIPGVGRAYVPPTQFAGVQCTLFRNIDGTHFEEVSEKAGIHVFEPDPTNGRQRPVGKALGVIVCDPDEDGWPDIAVANDTERNFFFHNVPGPGGTRRFEEIGKQANVALADGRPRGAMGIDWGEFRPGASALLIANFANEPDTLLKIDDPANLFFVDVAAETGLAELTRKPLKFGAFFFDYDLDGRLDVLTCNGHLEPDIAKARPDESFAQPIQLFWNTGRKPRAFEPVSAAQSGNDLFRPIVGRGCAYLDFDDDGDLDVVVTENNGLARLYRNDNNLGNHWVRLELIGDGTHSARDAIGAHLTVEAGGVVQHRYLSGARGYLSQSEHVVTIGLGHAEKVDRVTVRWPGREAGGIQEWKNLEVDRLHELRYSSRGQE